MQASIREMTRTAHAEVPPTSDALQALLSAAIDAAIVVADDGRVTAFNRPAKRIFRYPAKSFCRGVLLPAPFRARGSSAAEAPSL